MHNQWLFPW